MYDTMGDEQEIECPHCGKNMCIQDITTDGCLKPGHTDTCEHCHGEWEITEVEYTATVYVQKLRPYCPKCKNERRVRCEACRGIYLRKTLCTVCKGTSYVPCPDCEAKKDGEKL